MQIREFHLERFYAKYEFTIEHQLSASDCESLTTGELLRLGGRDPEDLLGLSLGYTETRGAPPLREAIASFYPGLSPADVLVCNAPQEAIFLAMNAILKAGDRVVVGTPCYPSLKEVARAIGCEVVQWDAVCSERGWSFDVDRLADLLREPTRLLVTNAPHNPTGALLTGPEWERIAQLVESRGAHWFSDEMYRGLESSPDLALPPAASISPRALSLWGTSKSFGLPGLRIGWLAGQDSELLARIEGLKDYTTICASAPGELLATVALERADEILRTNRGIIADNVEHMNRFALAHADRMTWHPPVGGSIGLAELRDGSAEGYADRIREAGAAVLVASTFFDAGDSHLRIGLGRRNFAEALERWESVGP